MVWTDDHPVECKVGGLKNGGYSNHKEDYHASQM
jgi:hypothetical protein